MVSPTANPMNAPQSTASGRPLQDVNIIGTSPLISPAELKREFPVSAAIADHVGGSRAIVENILRGDDKRVIAIVGPCSIHDPEMALEYARKLKQVADEVSDRLFVVMRVYFGHRFTNMYASVVD